MFRFQGLEIWQKAADLAYDVDVLTVELEAFHRYRYSEQLRAAAMSIANNIAEGSGSSSSLDFKRFLNYARKSAFETASMLLILPRRNLLPLNKCQPLVERLDSLCAKITTFSSRLRD
jgi:four helix bundle protein